ncbi:NAD(P)H-dependent flavin oxidoreductase [Natronorarus salvus]|uniref:NAD(P)H-dependent flavin oxidoreductase n=1 Tax=Natronorarus salvus TaxID=3117733 RepID=UPI002F25F0C0
MVRLKTNLRPILGVEHPIVQAPIGSSPELAAAVAEAGGLGMLSITWNDPESSRELLRKARELTDRPVAVNVVLDPDAKEVATNAALDAAIDEGVDVYSLSFGAADPYVDRIQDAGGVVLQTVNSAAEAVEAENAGVDVVVTQGMEAGGHVQSDVATFPLVPRVVDAVEVPVVAAGGIADGRGIAAALALGADGAWLGTRFVATREAAKHPRYQQRVLDASETDTELTDLFNVGWPGVPHRVVRNETVERWEDAGRPPAGTRPGEGETVAERSGSDVERYDFRSPTAETEGDVDAMALYAGQSAGLVDDLPSAANVVDELVEETVAAIEELLDLCDG